MIPILRLEQLAECILSKIRRGRPPASYKLTSLERSFKVNKDDFSSALNFLESWGYRLKRTTAEIKLLSAPDALTTTEILHGLKTKTIGRTVHAYQSVKSTNDIAARLAENNAAEGTIVTAEEQTKGRGRLGRDWFSPPRRGIYLSLILRPNFKPENAPGLSIMTALALAETIDGLLPGKVQIKWPNDILIHGRKAAGILTELTADKDKISYVVVGVGINVNHLADEFPAELRQSATSLRRELKKKADRLSLLREFLANFEREYLKYRKKQLTSSHGKVLKYSALIGTVVRLNFAQRIIQGKAIDIDSTGALIVDANGERTRITSGEVTVVKEKGK